MRSLLLGGALVFICLSSVESFVRCSGHASSTLGFMTGAVAVSRKRPRGAAESRPNCPAVPPVMAGSFTASASATSESAWFQMAGGGRRRCTRRKDGGGLGVEMLFGLSFQPPELSVWLHGTAQAVMLGAFAAIIPKVAAERIREKEEGLAMDDAYEAGLLDDVEDEDEFGYARGYVCKTCDNTNEVDCSHCGGKGFFVSASAMPKKCHHCNGLGKVPCGDCEERRELLRRERGARRHPWELPPSRGDDTPFSW